MVEIRELVVWFDELPLRRKVEIFTRDIPMIAFFAVFAGSVVLAEKLGLLHPDQ